MQDAVAVAAGPDGLEEGSELVNEDAQLEGLEQRGPPSRFDRQESLFAEVAGDEERPLRQLRVLAVDPAEKIVAANVRETEVYDNEIHFRRCQYRLRLFSRACRHGVEIPTIEQPPKGD